MTTKNASGKRRFGLLAAAAVAGTAIGLAAIYGIGQGDGNGGDELACASALKTAQTIQPLAVGEVAALLGATKPLRVSQLAFKDDDGNDMTLADFKGKTVLLNLWATWCAPCRKEMPALDRLEEKLGGEEFQVVAVNVDTRNPQRPRDFLKEINVSHLSYFADNSMDIVTELRSFGRARGSPSTMLSDGEGGEI